MFGIGARKPSSAEKIAAVETEMRMMAHLHNQYVFEPSSLLESCDTGKLV